MSADLETRRAEAMVVCAAVQDQGVVRALDLDETDFATPEARRLWARMDALAGEGWVGVEDLIARSAHNEQDASRLRDYVEAQLWEAKPADALRYAERVRHHAITRAVRQLAAEVSDLVQRRGLEGEELVVELQQRLANLRAKSRRRHSRTARALAEALMDVVEHYDDADFAGSPSVVVPTGLARVDDGIGGGWPGGVVSVLAARTSHGKSAFMLQCAIAAAERGIAVHLVSVEDLETDTGWRLVSRATGIPARELRRYRTLSAAERARVGTARAVLGVFDRIRITPASGLTAEQVVSLVRLHQRADATGLVLFDYLQRLPVGRGEKRHDVFSNAMDVFDRAAKEDGQPWVIASQLKRSEAVKPRLEDLRESGAIEEVAKLVIGLYRPNKGSTSADKPDNRMWIGVLKASNDELADALFRWDGDLMRITNDNPEQYLC